MIDRTSATIDIVLGGADANFYTVPAELREAAQLRDLAAELVLGASERRIAVQRGKVAELASEALLEALRASGKPPADFEETVLQAERDERAADIALAIANAAAEKARRNATQVLADLALPILVDHLRPSFDETLAAVAALAPALAGTDPDDAEAIIAAPPKVQAARARLVELADRHGAILRAFDALEPLLGEARHDDDGVHRRYRNAARLWGQDWARRRSHETRGRWPWPTARLAQLVWCATADSGAWLPLPRERDEALASFLRETAPPIVTGGPGVAPRLPWYAA